MINKKLTYKITLLYILIGIFINFIGVRIALFFEWPLFLDSIGTVLTAVLGGYLPGIIVGYFSNMINGISDPITLYYGILSILIAVTASFLSERNFFRHIGKTIFAGLIFSVIGGGLGSVLTWMLYGFSFGSGISAPFAIALNASTGLSEFTSQFIADMAIDMADKLITVLVIFFVLKFVPTSFLRPGISNAYTHDNTNKLSLKNSLKKKIIFLIVIFSFILGSLSIAISYAIYRNEMTERYLSTANGVIDLMKKNIPADDIDEFLADETEGEAYLYTEKKLSDIADVFDDIKYMYVYKICEDGCHVVFDVDTEDLPGTETGTVIPFESSFLTYKDDLLSGNEIPSIISNGSYGWLMTLYSPIYGSDGNCKAYAGVDVSMETVITDRYIFVIKMLSLLFGATIIIIICSIMLAEKKLIEPLNSIADAAGKFAYNDSTRNSITNVFSSLNIHTGDEIENLYHALLKTTKDVRTYITDIREQSETITKMQTGIIQSFAHIVESRDHNTGEHIMRTARYTEMIARELQRMGQFSDILNDRYIDKVVSSAPLHDIGKIVISDVLLNKPGRFTPEEYELMKTHTTAGRQILIDATKSFSDANSLSEATNMAAYHHEHWDGTGYPDGLSGSDIPLSARIMAVADVFDALVSKRSYKEPMPFDTAYDIILNDSGKQFDPTVVKAFMNIREEVRSILIFSKEV